jgi:hypothetical protein
MSVFVFRIYKILKLVDFLGTCLGALIESDKYIDTALQNLLKILYLRGVLTLFVFQKVST